MKLISKAAAIELYISSCKIMYEVTLTGDYKANNREGKKY